MHSEDHPHTESTFTGTLVNVRDLRRNSGECQGGSREYGVVGSPKFARLRQSSHEGARMLPVRSGTCLTIAPVPVMVGEKVKSIAFGGS